MYQGADSLELLCDRWVAWSKIRSSLDTIGFHETSKKALPLCVPHHGNSSGPPLAPTLQVGAHPALTLTYLALFDTCHCMIITSHHTTAQLHHIYSQLPFLRKWSNKKGKEASEKVCSPEGWSNEASSAGYTALLSLARSHIQVSGLSRPDTTNGWLRCR